MARTLHANTIVQLEDGRVGILVRNTGDPKTYWVRVSYEQAVGITPTTSILLVASHIYLAQEWLGKYLKSGPEEQDLMVQHGKAYSRS
jgi:hypothetical protein